MVKREIVFRLLLGAQGGQLRHLPMLGVQTDRIAQALQLRRKNFDQPLSIENLPND
jgi:hypothetical protein